MASKLLWITLLSLIWSASAFVPSVGYVTSRVATSYRTPLAAGPAVLEPPVKEKEKVEEKVISKDKDEDKQEAYSPNKGGWAVRLFNDPMNKREFVAMCLSKIAGLTDGQAYSVMMQAHKQGVAIVGRYDLERAELYRNSFNENGLSCDMIPVEED
jgi:ATP-dependent Clp protease adaptor protein ClpS